MLWFLLGVVVGVGLMAYGTALKIVGWLKYVVDEGDVHFFMQLDNPDISNILGKKYVVLQVDPNPTHE